MARFLHQDFSCLSRRKNRLSLAFFFVFGLISGGYLFLCADESFCLLMYRAFSCQVSIMGLAAVNLLPFLVSALAVSSCQPWLLRVLAYWKALSFSYVALGILGAYESGAWLAIPLLMFSDLCSIPILWLFWLRHTDAPGRDDGIRFWIPLIFIGCVDYYIISPFAAAL